GKWLPLTPHDETRHVAVSLDGQWVATGTHGGTKVKVWETTSGKLARELPVEFPSHVHFSPDGKWLATSGGGYRLWQVRSWSERPLNDAQGDIHVAFAPDGKLLAVANKLGWVQLVEIATGREVARLENPHQLFSKFPCFTPDGGQLIASGVNDSLHVWDLR